MDTLAEDTAKVLRKAVRACARTLRRRKTKLVGLDAGCGAGKWLPFLGGVVDELTAVDCSPKLVERAREAYAARGGGAARAVGRPRAPCAFGVADLAAAGALDGVEAADLVVSANVLIAPDRDICAAILATTLGRVAPGGYLALLVPSHESARAVANAYEAGAGIVDSRGRVDAAEGSRRRRGGGRVDAAEGSR